MTAEFVFNESYGGSNDGSCGCAVRTKGGTCGGSGYSSFEDGSDSLSFGS
jgi:hypothetical protein